MREIITTGKTLEAAVEAGCKALGVSRDRVQVEIIAQPKSGLFGILGASPAKVKVSVAEDDFSVKELLGGWDEKPAKKKEAPETEAAAETPAPKKEGGSKRRRHKKNKSERPENTEARAEAPETEEPELPAEPEKEIPLTELPAGAEAAFGYLKSIVEALGAKDIGYRAVEIKEGVKFVLEGEDASLLIGRRGETMDSLQYLCLLVSNRASDDYCKITLDVAGYRGRREKALQQLAQKVAKKVLKSGYNQTLEPMNPYERRIVHATIQTIEGVKSESVGQGQGRRVVVSLVSGGKESRRGRDGRRSREDRRDRRREPREPRESRPAATYDSEPQELPVRDIVLPENPREYQRIDAKAETPAAPEPKAEAPAPEKKEPADLNLYKKIEL